MIIIKGSKGILLPELLCGPYSTQIILIKSSTFLTIWFSINIEGKITRLIEHYAIIHPLILIIS